MKQYRVNRNIIHLFIYMDYMVLLVGLLIGGSYGDVRNKSTSIGEVDLGSKYIYS